MTARLLRGGLFACAALIGLLVVGAVVDLVRIRIDLVAGQDRLDRLDLDTIRRDGLADVLDGAADRIDAADSIAADSPFLGVLSSVPVVGRQVEGIRDLTGAAEELGDAARETGERISTALDAAGAEPSARVDLIDLVVAELDRIETLAATIDVGERAGLLPPLSSARDDVVDSLARVPERFTDLRAQITSLRVLLSGPTDYLVTVGNNAEMRTGAGMPLSAGLASIEDGDIALGDFKSTVSELYEPNPTGEFNADIPPQLSSTYPRWNLGRDFPETAVIGDFRVTAPIYADLAADTQGWETQGVVHVDAMALAALLEVVGPVQIGEDTYTSETAPQLVLNEPYIEFDTADERADRLSAQSDLAGALFEAIQSRDIDPLELIATLQTAAEGRHVMLWSRDPVLQELYASFGIDGGILFGDVLVSWLNTSANKLDWYIDPSVDLVVDQLDSGEWQLDITGTMTNPDGIRTSNYIDGLLPGLEGGQHRTLLLAQAPSVATATGIIGVEATEQGPSVSSKVIGTRFVVPRGETRTLTVRVILPPDLPGVRVMPSARVRPVSWTVNGESFDDDLPFFVVFSDLVPSPVDPTRRVLVTVAALGGLLAAAWLGLLGRRRVIEGVHAGSLRERVESTIGLAMAAVAVMTAMVSLLV